MKVALFIDYGPNVLNSKLKKLMNKPLPQARVDVAVIHYIETEGFELCESAGRTVYKIDSTYIAIQDVDISRPWMIADYDGSEFIQYVDVELVDEQLNYCKLKG